MSDTVPLAGVMGWPVSHSLSPKVHGHWLARYGLAGAYVPLGVQEDDFVVALAAMPKMGFVGANVTMPHKGRAFDLADERTETAARLGAANTLSFDPDRGVMADNTDGFGFIENLREARPGWRAEAGPAVVLGAGGASRAVIAALMDAGVPELRLLNRTKAKAEALRDEIAPRIDVLDWEGAEDALAGAALVVNATSMGMAGGPPLTLDLHEIGPDTIATDIVYARGETPFLTAARARGAGIVDGFGMLLHQARPGFERWFGQAPVVDDALRRAVLG
jgi:shikimate dehydrogenase